MKFGLFALALSPYFDEEGGGGAPAAPGDNVGAPAPSAPVAPVSPQFSYKEDRSNWVPSHVGRQQSEKFAAERAQIQAQLQFERERVAALSGTKFQAPADPEQDGIRAQFAKLYPGLAKMESMAEKFEKIAAFDFDGLKQSQEQSWTAHGNQVLQTLATKVKAAYGGAELTPKALKRITTAFVHEVRDEPEMRDRYDAGDLTIIDDFIKDYTSGVLDPYRRSTSAAAAPRSTIASKLPRGGGSSAIVGNRPASLKPSDPGFHEAAFRRLSGE
jgi:hypothetical protein